MYRTTVTILYTSLAVLVLLSMVGCASPSPIIAGFTKPGGLFGPTKFQGRLGIDTYSQRDRVLLSDLIKNSLEDEELRLK